MTHLLVDAEDVESLVNRLVASAEPVAIDLEADGMWAFHSQIRVVQIAARSPEGLQTYVLDPMAFRDLSLLSPLFAKGAPVTIFHDVSTDARLLCDADIETAGPVYDTQVAARFLGYQRLGLAAMTEALLGVTLDKGLQTHDWRTRPLTESQLVYLTGDVVHLHSLYDTLRAEIAQADLAAEVEVETRYVLGQAKLATEAFRRTPPWARVKGIGGLPEVDLARLRVLAEARATLAKARDLPETRFLANEALLAVGRKLQNPSARKLPAKYTEDEHRQWEAACDEALSATRLPAEEHVYIPRILRDENDSERQRVENALTTFRASTAKQKGIDPQAVLPGHCLREVAKMRPRSLDELSEIPGFGAVRVSKYGDAILTTIAAGRRPNDVEAPVARDA